MSAVSENLPSYAIGRSSIATDRPYPPIPTREFDWVAYLPDREGEGPTGYGSTEAQAIFNLCEELAEAYLSRASSR